MQRNKERPILLLTAAQVMLCGAMAVIVCAWALSICFILRELAQTAFRLTGDHAMQLLCGTGVAVCGLAVMVEMFRLMGRVKGETAFTGQNVRAMDRIVLSFGAAAVLLLPVGDRLMELLLRGTDASIHWAWGLLPSFVCGMVALLVRAIALLLRRAVEMQDESDLTV